MSSFYSIEELSTLGLKSYGSNVLISRYARLYNPSSISIGNNVRIDDFTILSGNITMGNYIHISPYVGIWANSGVVLDDFITISAGSKIYSESDDYSGKYLLGPTIPEMYRNVDRRKVIIGKYVAIGANVVILPGVILNEGCVIGVGSLVKKDCLPWMIYGGIPLRILKERCRDIIEMEKYLMI